MNQALSRLERRESLIDLMSARWYCRTILEGCLEGNLRGRRRKITRDCVMVGKADQRENDGV